MAIERDERPWGYFEVVDQGEGFRVKRICVDPGQRLSYQRHQHRSEHWFIVSGTATLDGVDRELVAGNAVDVPVGAAHRISNRGQDPVVFVEVQHGTSFAEDDIERLEDDYGRSA